jgi:hypothetical protein
MHGHKRCPCSCLALNPTGSSLLLSSIQLRCMLGLLPVGQLLHVMLPLLVLNQP